jgi:hypothetical protein
MRVENFSGEDYSENPWEFISDVEFLGRNWMAREAPDEVLHENVIHVFRTHLQKGGGMHQQTMICSLMTFHDAARIKILCEHSRDSFYSISSRLSQKSRANSLIMFIEPPVTGSASGDRDDRICSPSTTPIKSSNARHTTAVSYMVITSDWRRNELFTKLADYIHSSRPP